MKRKIKEKVILLLFVTFTSLCFSMMAETGIVIVQNETKKLEEVLIVKV